MSDRVVLLNQGRIEQIGTPEELYDVPPRASPPSSSARRTCIEGGWSAVAGRRPGARARLAGGAALGAWAARPAPAAGRPCSTDDPPGAHRARSPSARPAARCHRGDGHQARVLRRCITFELARRSGLGFVCSQAEPAALSAHWRPATRCGLVPDECRALPRDGGRPEMADSRAGGSRRLLLAPIALLYVVFLLAADQLLPRR